MTPTPCEFHPYEGNDDPRIIESMHNATRKTIVMTNAGLDAFEFISRDDGTHYVTNRATAGRCMTFDKLIGYSSGRMGNIDVQKRQWAPGWGRA